MYRLARVRAASVGPDSARFDRPHPGARAFDLDLTIDGEVADSVIWLENGGGKTVFLTLLFHVLRPDHAARIGDEGGKKGALQDFVLEDDVAHMQLEWAVCSDDGRPTGERLITGLVADTHGRGTGADKLQRTWYTLKVRDGSLSLDELTTDADGRRIPRLAFVDGLRERVKRASKRSGLDLRTTDTQGKWLAILDELGLDPALLDFQVQMNRAESGASHAFRFRTDEAFLEFFLGLVTDSSALDQATETLGRLAAKLASLPGKETEIAFATGALGDLEQLAEQHTRAERAAADLEVGQRDGAKLLGALSAAVEVATATAKQEQARHAEANDRHTEADRRRRALDDEQRYLGIDIAAFALAQSQEALKRARQAETERDATARAWAEVETWLDLVARRARVELLAGELARVEAEAAPLRERRDRAGSDLRRQHLADACVLAADAEGAERDHARQEAAAENTRGAAEAERRKATELGGELRGLRERVLAHTARCEEHVRRGHLRGGETPQEGVARHEGDTVNAATNLARIDGERRALGDRRVELATLRDSINEALPGAQSEARSARERFEAARRERAGLLAEPRLVELAGMGEGELAFEEVGPSLVQRLEAAARAADAHRVDAGVQAATDRRAVQSLRGEASLLPPRPEVAAVLEVLNGWGITSATAGWRYLADATAPQHRQLVLETCPSLVDGIVVPAPHLDRAVAALSGRSLRPTAAVVVGTIEELTAAEMERARPVEFPCHIVEPAEALYDRNAATAELEAIERRLEEVARSSAAFEAAARDDRALASRLGSHLLSWPAGALAAAEARAISAEEDVRGRVARRDEARSQLAKAEGDDRKLETERTRYDGLLRQADQAVAALERTAIEAAALADAEPRFASITIRIGEHEAEATRLIEQSRELREEATAHASRAAGLRQSADRSRLLAAGVPAPAHDDEASLRGASEASLALARQVRTETASAELAEKFRFLDDELRVRTTDSELSRELGRLRAELSQVERAWSLRPRELTEAVEKLGGDPQTQDQVLRAAARREADQACVDARERVAVARADHKHRESERSALPRPERPRAYDPPQTLEDAVARRREVEDLYAEAARDRSSAESERDEAARASAAAGQRAATLTNQCTTLRNAMADVVVQESAPPFEGREDAAIEEVGELLDRIGAATRALSAASRACRRHADALAAFARGERWQALPGLIFRRLAHDSSEQLARDAASLHEQLRLLRDRLQAEIDAMAGHRTLLVASLAELVGGATSNLRLATNRSRLPDQLRDWSNRPFLRIDFEPPADAEIEHRLSAFVTDLLGRAPDRRPVGAKLLTQAVLACVAGGIRVSVLKPNAAMALIYVGIGEMAVFSGGMRATAAIAMFCTIARLRAANRGRRGDRGVATLILDNPFGDASAVYLVSLQRVVAQGAGIQLVYTTGIKDLEALRVFPNPIRLSNASAVRKGLAFVVGDDKFRAALWPEGDDARVRSTRLMRTRAPQLLPP